MARVKVSSSANSSISKAPNGTKSKSIRSSNQRSRMVSGKIIEVHVGNDGDAFNVHELVIRASSSFFDRALGGKWQESSQGVVKLQDDEPKIFALYIHWLYFGTIPVSCDEPDTATDTEYIDLVKAHVMGDKLLDLSFRKATIDAMVEKSLSKSPDDGQWDSIEDAILHAYSNPCGMTSIRQVLVDTFVHNAHSGWLRDWNPPHDFLSDLASALLDHRTAPRKSLDASNYHVEA